MRKLGILGLEVALCIGLGAAAALAADGSKGSKSPASEKESKSSTSWFGRWFGSKKEPEPKVSTKIKKGSEADSVEAEQGPTVNELAAVRARQEKTLLRRLAVCDRLMEIAVRTGDDDLLRRAEQLDERCRRAYAERTADVTAQSDELILEKHLGGSGASLAAPGREDGRQTAAAKEEKP